MVRQQTRRLGRAPDVLAGLGVTALYMVVAYVLARTLVAHHVALSIAALVVRTAAYLVVAGLTSGSWR